MPYCGHCCPLKDCHPFRRFPHGWTSLVQCIFLRHYFSNFSGWSRSVFVFVTQTNVSSWCLYKGHLSSKPMLTKEQNSKKKKVQQTNTKKYACFYLLAFILLTFKKINNKKNAHNNNNQNGILSGGCMQKGISLQLCPWLWWTEGDVRKSQLVGQRGRVQTGEEKPPPSVWWITGSLRSCCRFTGNFDWWCCLFNSELKELTC